MTELKNRCANCWDPHHMHIKRMSAAPACRKGGVYREATEEELSAKYAEVFPEGPKPIATFRADNPDDVARAKRVLSPTALNEYFGPGGRGMAGFVEALGGGS